MTIDRAHTQAGMRLPRDPFRETALLAALNVLRDSVEAGRMPSGIELDEATIALHARAARWVAYQLEHHGLPPRW